MLLGAKAIWEDATLPGGLANKVAAHKYLAFSYCVTNRRTLCRQQFVDAIKIDPLFQLEPAEKTHPIWGPEFDRAKVQASTPPRAGKTPTRGGNAAIESAKGSVAKRRLRISEVYPQADRIELIAYVGLAEQLLVVEERRHAVREYA